MEFREVNVNFKIKNKIFFLDILLIFLFIIFLYLAISNIGEITFPGDPLGMWDKWAKSFAASIIPGNSMDYPQAYPILMSLTYILIGTLEIEFFSRSVGLAYPILIWFMMLRVIKIIPNYENEIKLTLFFTALLTLNQFRHTLFIGFVDPILVFSTVAVGYILILDKHYKFKENYILIICLIAILPGLLKQTALYLSVTFPIFFYFFKIKSKHVNFFKTIFIYLILFSIILFPWYLYKIYLFSFNEEGLQALNLSFFSDTNQLVKNENNTLLLSVVLNLKYGLQLVFGKFYLLILFMIIIGSFKNFYTKVTLFLILPYFFLWSNIFANDARNFAFMLPLVAFILSLSSFLLIKYINNLYFKLYKKKANDYSLFNNLLLIGFIFFSIYFINEKRNDEVIFEKHFKKQLKRTNYPEVNILLYNYFKNKNLSEIDIIMYDWDFTQLPKFKDSKNLSCHNSSIDYLKKNYNENIYYLIKNVNSVKV